MGVEQSHQNLIHDSYNLIKERKDGSQLLKHKKTKEEFLLRIIGSNSDEEIEGFIDLLNMRQKLKSPHLLELVLIQKGEQKQTCSMLHKLSLLIQYPFKTLKDEIDEKIRKGRKDAFSEAELWSILYSCCMGLRSLYKRKICHECLRAQQIFINKEGLVKICDPLLLGLQKNYITVMKKSEQNPPISPQIMNFLDDCNFSFYDKEKSDIFILGVIMIQSALLDHLSFYDFKAKKPALEKLPIFITQMRNHYSQMLCDVVEKMVIIHSKMRPSFADIIAKVEEENTTSVTQSADWSPSTKNEKQENIQLHSHNSSSANIMNPKVEFKYVNHHGNQHGIQHGNQHIQHGNQHGIQHGIHYGNQATIIAQLSSANFKPSVHDPTQLAPSEWALADPPYKMPRIDVGGEKYKTQFNNPKPDDEHNMERFSYHKFGNIQIGTKEQKKYVSFLNQPHSFNNNSNSNKDMEKSNEPIFTSDIPRLKHLFSPVVNFDLFEKSDGLKKQVEDKSNEKCKQIEKKVDHSGENMIAEEDIESLPSIRLKQKTTFVDPLLELMKQDDKITYSLELKKSLTEKYKCLENRSKEENRSNDQDRSKEEKYGKQCIPEKDVQNYEGVGNRQFTNVPLEGGGRYQGYVQNGMKNGQGRLDFKDGGYYFGEWRNNKMNGYGKLHYENGDVAYEGQWKDDEFNGFGRVYNDRPQKIDTPFNWHDFSELGDQWVYYEGDFKADSKHGKGKIELTNGEVFEGNFIWDVIEGEGVFYCMQGEKIEGVWGDNMANWVNQHPQK